MTDYIDNLKYLISTRFKDPIGSEIRRQTFEDNYISKDEAYRIDLEIWTDMYDQTQENISDIMRESTGFKIRCNYL